MTRVLVSMKEEELLWVEKFLGIGTNGFFEKNPLERKLCDNVYFKICKALNKLGYNFNTKNANCTKSESEEKE